MLSAYPAYFYEEYEGGYSVIFPDLNHLATQGDNLNEALEMAIDCLAGYLYILEKEGKKAPLPSDLKNLNVDNEYTEYKTAFVNMVTVDVAEYAKLHFEKPIKKTLTIPKWLNDTAISAGVNFSNVLQNALLKELKLNL